MARRTVQRSGRVIVRRLGWQSAKSIKNSFFLKEDRVGQAQVGNVQRQDHGERGDVPGETNRSPWVNCCLVSCVQTQAVGLDKDTPTRDLKRTTLRQGGLVYTVVPTERHYTPATNHSQDASLVLSSHQWTPGCYDCARDLEETGNDTRISEI